MPSKRKRKRFRHEIWPNLNWSCVYFYFNMNFKIEIHCGIDNFRVKKYPETHFSTPPTDGRWCILCQKSDYNNRCAHMSWMRQDALAYNKEEICDHYKTYHKDVHTVALLLSVHFLWGIIIGLLWISYWWYRKDFESGKEFENALKKQVGMNSNHSATDLIANLQQHAKPIPHLQNKNVFIYKVENLDGSVVCALVVYSLHFWWITWLFSEYMIAVSIRYQQRGETSWIYEIAEKTQRAKKTEFRMHLIYYFNMNFNIEIDIWKSTTDTAFRSKQKKQRLNDEMDWLVLMSAKGIWCHSWLNVITAMFDII